MKLSLSKTYNNVKFFRWKKYCSSTVQVWSFVDKIIEENPNIIIVSREVEQDYSSDSNSFLVIITGITADNSGKSKKKRSKEALSSKELKWKNGLLT